MSSIVTIELITLSVPVVPPLRSFQATLQSELQSRDPHCELLRWAIVRVERASPYPIAHIEAVITRTDITQTDNDES
ncbi:MAG: hypothetical protein HC818_00225 [Synechococcaceae cyanobacterium RM1_1_27]|nr:hypothetical protein [Synechococcaceae cyanobacterium RM1_1_27]